MMNQGGEVTVMTLRSGVTRRAYVRVPLEIGVGASNDLPLALAEADAVDVEVVDDNEVLVTVNGAAGLVEVYYFDAEGVRMLKFEEIVSSPSDMSLLFVVAEAAVVDGGALAGLEDVEIEAVTEAKKMTRSGEVWQFAVRMSWLYADGPAAAVGGGRRDRRTVVRSFRRVVY